MEDPSAMIQGVFHLLQAVAQEPQELHHVLMPYEHCNGAQGAATLPLRKSPVYPSDPEGLPEADLGPLPSDGEEFLVPDPPDPAGLQPLGKLLGLGHVALHVAGRLFPSLHGFDAGTGVEVPLGVLPCNLIPGRRDETAHLAYCSERWPHEQEYVEVPCSSLLYAQPPEGSEGPVLPLKALAESLQVVLADLRALWIFVRIGQR